MFPLTLGVDLRAIAVSGRVFDLRSLVAQARGTFIDVRPTSVHSWSEVASIV